MKFVLFNLEVDIMGTVWRLQTRTDSKDSKKYLLIVEKNLLQLLGGVSMMIK